MSLHPTPTRLRLLRAVADGNVWHHIPADETDTPAGDWLQHDDAGLTTVTSRCAEMQREGWIEPPPVLNLGTYFRAESGPWRITEAGRAVLDAGLKARA